MTARFDSGAAGCIRWHGKRSLMLLLAIVLLAKPAAGAFAADTTTAHSSVDIAPKAILFESQEVGNPIEDSGKVAVTFTNSAAAGGAPVEFSGPVISRGFAIVSNECSGQLMPAASCSITVAFAPIAEGLQHGTLQVVTDAINSPHIVKLKGKGIAAPLTFQKKLDFGELKLDGAPPAMNLTLTNNSQTTIKFSSVAASPPFNVIANSCDTLEAGGGSCVVRVEFAPGTTGIFKGILELRDTAARNPQHVKLMGAAN